MANKGIIFVKELEGLDTQVNKETKVSNNRTEKTFPVRCFRIFLKRVRANPAPAGDRLFKGGIFAYLNALYASCTAYCYSVQQSLYLGELKMAELQKALVLAESQKALALAELAKAKQSYAAWAYEGGGELLTEILKWIFGG
jgi:hypothetical protein